MAHYLPLQSKAIRKFFCLLLFSVVLVIVFFASETQCFTADAIHQQSERVVMIFFQQRPPVMRYLQVVKEHINVRRFIAYINIQISALIYCLVRSCMCGVGITAAYLFKPTVAAYIIELLIKQYPVDKRFGLAANN